MSGFQDLWAENNLPDAVVSLRLQLLQAVQELCLQLCIVPQFLAKAHPLPGEGTGVILGRNDYALFCKEAARSYKNTAFTWQFPSVQDEYPFPQARLLIDGSIMSNPLTEDLAMHQGVYLNIFPAVTYSLFDAWQREQYAMAQGQLLQELGLPSFVRPKLSPAELPVSEPLPRYSERELEHMEKRELCTAAEGARNFQKQLLARDKLLRQGAGELGKRNHIFPLLPEHWAAGEFIFDELYAISEAAALLREDRSYPNFQFYVPADILAGLHQA